MRRRWALVILVLAGGMVPFAGLAGAAETAQGGPQKKVKLLVVAGGHPYQEVKFRAIFGNFHDMECTFVEEKKGGEAFSDISHFPYDAILLYNFQKNPSQQERENFLKLMDRGVGLVILHHAIYGYRDVWPEFQQIVGVTSWLTGSKDGVHYKIHVADPNHPITKGLEDFPIHDEVYLGHGLDPKMHVILTTDEPSNSKHIAWVHTYRNAPVCYFQLGHDENAYNNPQFQTVLGQAVRWVAGRLPK
jgi:type 1 glutamine amidotransferase